MQQRAESVTRAAALLRQLQRHARKLSAAAMLAALKASAAGRKQQHKNNSSSNTSSSKQAAASTAPAQPLPPQRLQLQDTDSCSTPVADADAPPQAAAMQRQAAHAGRYLIITVQEARNLVACDAAIGSADAYARVSIAGASIKTRTIHRSCHPMWQHRQALPIDGLTDGEPLRVEVFARLRHNFSQKAFLGQVLMTLGKALEIAAQPGVRREQFWCPLSKARTSDVVRGELCCGFAVMAMDPQQHLAFVAEQGAGRDAGALATAFGSKALRVQLHGLTGLYASGLFPPAGRAADSGGGGGSDGQPDSSPAGSEGQLVLAMNWGGELLQEKLLPALPAHRDDVAGSQAAAGPTPARMSDDDGLLGPELVVEEECIVALAPALRAARKRLELTDVSFTLKWRVPWAEGLLTLAKTQLPLAALLPPDGRAAAADAGLQAALDGGTAAPLDAASVLQPAAGCADGARPPCKSLPATPRAAVPPTPGDFRLAAHRTDASRPYISMERSASVDASDAAGLRAQLASCGSLSALSTCSAGSRGGAAAFVEGSLRSVTASSRGQQASPLPGARRVQGLAELALKGKRLRVLRFAAAPAPRGSDPAEGSRSAWAPIARPSSGIPLPDAPLLGTPAGATAAAVADDTSSSSSSTLRRFRRTMQCHVPVSANLELHVSLGVVQPPPQQQAGLDALQGAAGLDGCDTPAADFADAEDEDSGAGPDAPAGQQPAAAPAPMQLPEPLAKLLQDVGLSGISVRRLFELVLGSGSQVVEQHYAAQELSNVSVGSWSAAPPGSGCRRLRTVSYTKPLRVPMAPPSCKVQEQHRLIACSGRGFVAEISCVNDAPFGDSFQACVQLCGVPAGRDSSRLRISMELRWSRAVWAKKMVTSSAEADARRGWAAFVQALQAARSISRATSGPAPAAQAGGASGLGAETQLQGRASLSPVAAPGVAAALQAALVVAVLGLALAVWFGARDISMQLQALSEAVRESRREL